MLHPLIILCLQIHDADDFDFDYNDVHITESAVGKSYEDASLLEDLSANANEAFQQAELDSRNLFQKDNLGFFAANLKAEQNKVELCLKLRNWSGLFIATLVSKI